VNNTFIIFGFLARCFYFQDECSILEQNFEVLSDQMNEYRHNSSEAIQRTQPGWFHPRRYYLKMLRKLIEYAIEKHIPNKNGILVDYGCGSMPYKTLFETKINSYLGADLSDNPAIDIHLDEQGKLNYADSAADILLSTQVLEHVDDPELYLQESHRILKNDGLLLLTTHGYWMFHPDPNDFWRWTSSGLKKVVERNGFEVIDFRGIIGRPAMGLQLFQDGLMFNLPSPIKQIFIFIMQIHIYLFDKVTKQQTKNTDACTFLIVARAKK
jgi:SAM-dependent methyltransferase